MPEDDLYTRFATVRAKPPPRTSGITLHWDGMNRLSPSVECMPVLEHGTQTAVLTQPLGSAPQASSTMLMRHSSLVSPPPACEIAWHTHAAHLTFYLDLGLLLPTAYTVNPGATGTLLWVHSKRDTTRLTPTVHPALLVQTAASFHMPCVELVPHLSRHDPLLQHIALVLQATVEAEGVAGRLYAEALANALAVHLLNRYAIGRHREQPCHGGLPPGTLHRTIAYILAHLEYKLSLDELAAVAHISPAHFARLFKGATGQTPHQYVLTCRMDQAKQLLATTDLSLSQISLQVGCADQSHFTALFRKYVSMTPNAYRNASRSTFL